MRLLSLLFITSLLNLCYCGGLDSSEIEILNTLANSLRKFDPIPQGEPIQPEQNHKDDQETPQVTSEEPTTRIKLENVDSFQQPLTVVVPQPDRLSAQITKFLQEQIAKLKDEPRAGEIVEPSTVLYKLPVQPQDLQRTPQPLDQSQEPTFSITLDLANPDTAAIDVKVVVASDGAKGTYYYQLGNIFFDEVRDGDEEIWESIEEKCILAYTISRGHSTNLYLLLKTTHSTHFLEYERGSDGAWTRVERKEFAPKLTELDPQISQFVDEKGIYKPETTASTILDEDYGDEEGMDVLDKTLEHFMTIQESLEETDGLDSVQVIPKNLIEPTIAATDAHYAISTPQKHTIPITLDLFSPDESKINVHKQKTFKTTSYGYSPKNGFYVVSVLDDGREIWNAGEGEGCVYAESFIRENFLFFTIDVNSGGKKHIIRFKRVCGNWSKISCTVFTIQEYHNLLHSPVTYSDGHTGCILDISKPDETKIEVRIFEYYGFKKKRYFRMGNSYMSSVMDGEEILWTASKDEECKGVIILSDDNTTLLTLQIINFRWPERAFLERISEKLYKTVGGKHIPKFFVKNAPYEKWTEITLEAYNERQRTMKSSILSPIVSNRKHTGHLRRTINPTKQIEDESEHEVDRDGEVLPEEGEHEVDRDGEVFSDTYLDLEPDSDEAYLDPLMEPIKTLDIYNPDRHYVNVSENVEDGVLYRAFSLKPGYYTCIVSDNGTVLWSSGEGEGCTLAGSCSKESTILLAIGINNGESTEYKFLEKLNGKWNEVTHGEMKRKLTEMTGISPKPISAYTSEEDETLVSKKPFEQPHPLSATRSHDPEEFFKSPNLISRIGDVLKFW